MTMDEFCKKVHDLCHRADRQYLAGTIIEMASKLEVLLTQDRKLVDAIELMLYQCLIKADHYVEGCVYDCLKRDIPGLQEWLAANDNRLAIEIKKAELMEERERRRVALAKVERELEEMER